MHNPQLGDVVYESHRPKTLAVVRRVVERPTERGFTLTSVTIEFADGQTKTTSTHSLRRIDELIDKTATTLANHQRRRREFAAAMRL